MTDRKLLNRWLRWLKRKFPLIYPVRVLLVPRNKVPECGDGHCTCNYTVGNKHPDRFTIHLADDLNWRETQGTLWEAWAHAQRMHLFLVGDPQDHDEVYAVLFNRIQQGWNQHVSQE